MTSEYEEIFAKRGHSYDRAMQEYPEARDREFENLFNFCTPQPGFTVLDIPSGGGYLAKHLPDSCLLESVEPSGQFPETAHLSREADLENLRLPEGRYDIVVCLAASHHIGNKQGLFHAAHRTLNPGGHFLLGDVAHGNPITLFLDEFSSRYNDTGHAGDYLTIEAATKMANRSGFQLLDVAEYACPWTFDNRANLTEFCRLLFGLTNLDNAVLFDALAEMVGVTETVDGVQLDWRLLYVTCRRDR